MKHYSIFSANWGKVILLIVALFLSPICVALGPIIVIVSKSQQVAYAQVIDSFKQGIIEQLPEANFVNYDQYPSGNIKPGKQPSLVFALGSKAVIQARDKFNHVDLLATMLIDNKLLENVPYASSILLKTSPLSQLKWHQHILPQHKRIGVLYDPRLNQDWVDSAKLASKSLKLQIIAIAVHSPREIPAGLKALGRQADSILAIPDKTVYSSKTAQQVLLFSFHNRLPFIGLSDAWVKAGALYALYWDYQEIGRQSANLALKNLKGDKRKKSTSALPNKLLYQLNLKTSKRLKLDPVQSLIDNATKVYR